jgi:hypothetical protein
MLGRDTVLEDISPPLNFYVLREVNPRAQYLARLSLLCITTTTFVIL